jgi:hypothetical protein
MKYLYIPLVALLMSVFGCSKSKVVTFKINKGKHRSKPYIYFDSKKVKGIEFTFTTDDSWLFPPPANNGWSKLFGVAAGCSAHNNSARFVFINRPEGLYLGGYCYLDKTSPQEDNSLKESIAQLQANRKYKASIIRENGNWVFTFHPNNTDTLQWNCPCGNMKRRLWVYKPYMGGTYTIGQDWRSTIEYNWIK